MKTETIETPRLFLRSFTKEDARFAISIWNDPEMGEYLPDEALEEIDEEYVKEIEKCENSEDCHYLISELKDTHERIGTCSFMCSDDEKIYDLAYCVHKSQWRNGYATEMAKGMIDYAKVHGAEKITVKVDKENVGSNKVVKKLGFEVAEEHFYIKKGVNVKCSTYIYELKL